MAVQSQMLALLKQAAQLRACGMLWAEIAKVVNRDEGTLRHWPSDHRAQWNEFFNEAADTFIREKGVAALERQEGLALHAEDEKVKQNANHSILALWAKLFRMQSQIEHTGGGLVVKVVEAEKPKDA